LEDFSDTTKLVQLTLKRCPFPDLHSTQFLLSIHSINLDDSFFLFHFPAPTGLGETVYHLPAFNKYGEQTLHRC